MNKVDILVKCITLLFREAELNSPDHNSNDLVLTILGTVNDDAKFKVHGGENDLVENLKNLIANLCTSDYEVVADKISLLQTLELIVKDSPRLLKTITKNIEMTLDNPQMVRVINNTRKFLTNHYRDFQMGELINKANYSFRMNRSNVRDKNAFLDNFVSQLEALKINNTGKDKAVSGEMDIGNASELKNIIDVVKEEEGSLSKLKLGWQGLNTMSQGGWRRGEFIVVNALQHKYKTGFTLSTFMQIAMFNKPVMIHPDKKPLLLWVSLEDDLTNIGEFMYKYLYVDEHGVLPDIKKVTSDEVSEYVKERLGAMGYHVKVMRVDPTEWSFKQLFNMVISLEMEGYELHGLYTDYLSMVPTVGCNTNGAGGTDLREMFRRVRNFCASRKIAYVTPHQLSTQAKELLRAGVPDIEFLDVIREKGYFSGSKQLDQEMDLELYVHVLKAKKEHYLNVVRGKHRQPTIIDDSDKTFFLKFPYKAPIPSDVNRTCASVDLLNNSINDTDGFDF